MDRRSERESKLYILGKPHETTLSRGNILAPIVESKKNNSELVKSVKALQDIENKYTYIIHGFAVKVAESHIVTTF